MLLDFFIVKIRKVDENRKILPNHPACIKHFPGNISIYSLRKSF